MSRHRDKNPENPANWQLRCVACDKLFGDQELVEVLKEHFDKEHPGEKCGLNLKWIGFGPAPKTAPRFLS